MPRAPITVTTRAPRTGEAPILSIFGGKITTYRRLAEHALERLKAFFPAAGAAALPK